MLSVEAHSVPLFTLASMFGCFFQVVCFPCVQKWIPTKEGWIMSQSGSAIFAVMGKSQFTIISDFVKAG